MHHLTFIPSTSFCSLSSWFTSSCAYITSSQSPPSFSPFMCPLAFCSRLENPSVPQIFSSVVFLVPVHCLHRIWISPDQTWHFGLFLFVFIFLYYGLCADHTISFSAYISSFCHSTLYCIISYYILILYTVREMVQDGTWLPLL